MSFEELGRRCARELEEHIANEFLARKLKNRPAGRASVTWLAERRVYEVRCLAPDGAVITISEHSTPYDRMVSLTFECQCGAGFHKNAGQRRRQDDDQVDEVEHGSGSGRDPVAEAREALERICCG